MHPTSPRISIVVPHYQDLAGLDRCLSALSRQTPPGASYEIVVADNASPVGEDAVRLTIADRARLVVVPEKGAGPARNGGAAVAAGEILAFTDSDCVPEPGWLAAGVAALEVSDLVGGRMDVLVDNPERMTGPEAFEMVFAFDNEGYVRDKGFTVTANLFVRRADFERVGRFRVGVSEDVEWCHRAIGLGYRLAYCSDAAVGHPARRTWAELHRKWQRIGEEQYLLAVDQGKGGRLAWLARTWALPASMIVHGAKLLMSSRKLPRQADRWRALGVLLRLRGWRFVENHRLALRR